MALTQIQQAMLVDGILTADAAGRLKMADGFVNDAKISGVAASKISGQLADANMSPGSVIQVVQSHLTTKIGLTGSAYVGLDVTITPSSTSSKILILGSIAFGRSNLNGAVKMLRNGNTFMPDLASAYQGGASAYGGAWNTADDSLTGDGDYSVTPVSFLYLDSPSSTSSQQYRLYYYQASGSGNGDLYVNRQRTDNGGAGCSNLTVLEIAG